MTSDISGETATAHDLHRQGDADHAAGRYADALAAFQAAAALAPDNPILHYNIAGALRLLNRYAEAIAAYDQALAIAPAFSLAHHNRATCLLQLGDLFEGFRAFEWRKAAPGFDDPRYGLPRQWAGESLAGRRLFIYPEFYQGDLLQFARYALLAEAAGAEVTLAAPRAMHRVLQTLSPRLRLIDEAETPADHDLAVALLSLPAAFGTRLSAVPHGRYLHAEPDRVAHWRARIGHEGLKVGIVWQGSEASSAPPVPRSYPLTAAAPLGDVPGVRLISLQKGLGIDQIATSGVAIETLGEGFDAGPDLYLDTAAAIACCDLVVAMDGSVMHLAGALGGQVWLAVPQVADWRWMNDRSDSPWYPNARLYRQSAFNDWQGVFAAMARDLRVRINA